MLKHFILFSKNTACFQNNGLFVETSLHCNMGCENNPCCNADLSKDPLCHFQTWLALVNLRLSLLSTQMVLSFIAVWSNRRIGRSHDKLKGVKQKALCMCRARVMSESRCLTGAILTCEIYINHIVEINQSFVILFLYKGS